MRAGTIKRLFIFSSILGVLLYSAVYAGEKENPRETPVVKAINKALPSVVNLNSRRKVSSKKAHRGIFSYFSSPEDKASQTENSSDFSLGSGCLIDKTGLIVTCAHVVDKAVTINAAMDKEKFQAAELASDSSRDLALLQIKGAPPREAKAIQTAIPGDLMLGETVIALGNPYGLGNSASKGILSATGRDVIENGKIIYKDLLQTDAAIYPGNSGGPLINISGKMIGINTAVHKNADKISFAIPLKQVENTLAAWLIPERFNNAFLGFIPAVKPLEKRGETEIFAKEVFPDSPAAESGLQRGDKIESLNGKKVDDLLRFSRKICRLKAGDAISVGIAGGRKIHIKLAHLSTDDGQTAARLHLGLDIQKLDKPLAEALGYPFDRGCLISDIHGDRHDSIKRGDVLARIGDYPIKNPEDISKALRGKKHGDKISAVLLSVNDNRNKNKLHRSFVELKYK